jgi:hypothetical protein
MQGEGHRPKQRAQEGVEDRGAGVHDADPASPDRVAACRRPPPAVPSLRAALTAALHQRVAQRAAWELRAGARSSSGIFASTAWMRQRSWCSPRRGVGRWASVRRVSSHRPRTARRLRPDDPCLGLCQG